jgi:hypothetical protein
VTHLNCCGGRWIGARYHTLTNAGREQLATEQREFDRLIVAIHRVLNTT